MTDEDTPFDSPLLLLAGANRHLETFKERLEELRRTPNWAQVIANPDTPGEMLIQVNVKPPPDMKQIVFDFTGNLRSALDHAVYASAVELTGIDFESGTKFPFGETEKDARDDARRRCKNVPLEMVDFLLAFEPHRNGNPLLWALNKLRNTKSHRVLVAFPASTEMLGPLGATPESSAAHEWDRPSGRFKIDLTPPPGGAAIAAFGFRLELLVGTGAFRGHPASRIFDRMIGEVQRIVAAIEAETARLLKERGP